MSKLNALVISSGIEGSAEMFTSHSKVHYTIAEVTHHFPPDLAPYDLLIVPNGSDHMAMLKLKEAVQQFLARGKALCCFDGWFTPWVPGNQWIMDNQYKTINVRYKVGVDRYGLMRSVDLQQLIFSHGISGWWACGYIQAHTQADVLLEDTWHRPVAVLDEVSTPGLMFLTASGPLADRTDATTDDHQSEHAIVALYQNFLQLVLHRKEKTYV